MQNIGTLPVTFRPFIDCIDDWLERKRRRVRLDTYEAYQSYISIHIKPFFKPLNLYICDVTPRLIQQYIDQKEFEGLSPNSIIKHLVVFNGVFKEAKMLQEISINPCECVTVYKKDEAFHGEAYEISDIKCLLKAIKGDPIEPAVYLGLYLGLRRSEVVGLRWKDVDFEQNIVRICNTVVRVSTTSEQEKTKTRASRRDLFIPNGLREYLLKRKIFSLNKDGYVCQWPDGRPYTPCYISMRFKKVLTRSGLRPIRFHDLRHTAGSLLINSGQSVKQVQEFLGHEKASTTLDIYTHLSMASKQETACKMDDILSAC